MTHINNFVVLRTSSDSIKTNLLTDKINGNGKLYIVNEDYNYVYTGEIKDGTMNGIGLITYKYNKIDPGVYSYYGNFVDNKYKGHGKITYTNGEVFIGEFLDNKKHGPGKLYNIIGEVIMNNIWKNNIINGKIKFTENFLGTNILKVEGYLLNLKKIGIWIYYNDNTTVDKIEYYDDKTEILLSMLKINNNGYIATQQIFISNNINIDQLVQYNSCKKTKITFDNVHQNINELRKISIPTIKTKYNYLVLDDNCCIRLIYNSHKDYHINFLRDNKYCIDDNIFSLVNNKLVLYYTGNLGTPSIRFIPHGNGILYENTLVKYKGIFENGLIKNGKRYSSNTPQYVNYNGCFVNNIPHGKGIFYNENGTILYDGNIKFGIYNEFGISYWTNTGIKNWEGEWLNGQKHGTGYLYDEAGILICHCQFENDNLITVI
jgi:hypothetical protein